MQERALTAAPLPAAAAGRQAPPQQLAQFRAAPVQPGLHGADRNLEHAGDLLVGHALQLAQHEHGAVLLVHVLQLLAHQLLELAALQRLGRGGAGVGQLALQVRALLADRRAQAVVPRPRPALPVLEAVAALVDRDREQPAAEARLAPELAEAAVGLDEDLLGEVEGLVVVAENPVGHVERPPLMIQHELFESPLVPGARPAHRLRVGVRPRCRILHPVAGPGRIRHAERHPPATGLFPRALSSTPLLHPGCALVMTAPGSRTVRQRVDSAGNVSIFQQRADRGREGTFRPVPGQWVCGDTGRLAFMISVAGVSKRFGGTLAVDDVSFEVARGEILGLLGPNGAGKTTTMRILSCFLAADTGSATVAGFDVAAEPLEVRRRLGYLPENNPLYFDMTVAEYLSLVAEVRRVPRADKARLTGRAVEGCGLGPVRGRIIGQLSKGYRQRVGLAGALLHDPEVLILDEPTVGLDPTQIIEIRELIRGFGSEKAVLLSSHILPEVEATCQRVLIFNEGHLVGQGTPAELAAQARGSEFVDLAVRGPRDADRPGDRRGPRRRRVRRRRGGGGGAALPRALRRGRRPARGARGRHRPPGLGPARAARRAALARGRLHQAHRRGGQIGRARRLGHREEGVPGRLRLPGGLRLSRGLPGVHELVLLPHLLRARGRDACAASSACSPGPWSFCCRR